MDAAREKSEWNPVPAIVSAMEYQTASVMMDFASASQLMKSEVEVSLVSGR